MFTTEWGDVASERGEIDDRYDPAFQRGFDGQTDAATRDPRPATRLGAAAGAIASDRVAEVPPVTRPPRRDEPLPPVDDDAAADSWPPPLTGNPWVRVLWVIAVVFTVGGIAAQVWAQEMYGRNVSVAMDAIIIPNLLQALGSPMVMIGLATGAGTALLHATRWRRHL